MPEWKPYFGNRLRKDHPSGFVVIVPVEREEPIPLWCPVCMLLMRSSDDAQYFRTKKCCSRCGMKWADPNMNRWKTGWRPSHDEIDEEVKLRQSVPIAINLDVTGD